MNPPDDIQDIVIAAIRKVMALPESLPIIPQHHLADDLMASESDMLEMLDDLELELDIVIETPLVLATVADVIETVKKSYK